MKHTEIKDYIQNLRDATNKITGWLSDLDERACEIDLFFQRGPLLQAAIDPKDAYPVITELARQLFPTETGALYLCNTSQARELLERVVVWPTSTREKASFGVEDCWALRSGKVYLVDADSPGSCCKHVHASTRASYLCVPMMAHGETLGVLYLKIGPNAPLPSKSKRAQFPEAKQRLAIAFAGHIALAIANLRLRVLLTDQATHDPLTGLFNRRYLDETLGRELRRAKRGDKKDDNEKPVGIIYFDVDHFKRFNATYTHRGGDQVLRMLGNFLKDEFCRRPGDIACRMGGEEFAVVLPGTSLENTRRRAEELRREVKQLNVALDGQPLGRVTVSLGVATFPDHASTPEDLIKVADKASLRAKGGGRDRVVVARPANPGRGRAGK